MNQTLPHSPAAERAILGCLMLDGITAFERCGRLREEMLALDSHRRIFSVLRHLIENEHPVDIISIVAGLRKARQLDSVGGVAYLSDMTNGIPRNFDCAHHVETIIEKWKLRSGLKICERYAVQFQEEENSDQTLSLMQSEVFDAMQEMTDRDDPSVKAYTVREIDAALDYLASPMGMSYGNEELDKFTLGMQDGQVTVVGARSGVGKSSLVCQAVAANCRIGVPVDVFSLEMKRGDVLRRLWAIEAELPFVAIQRKQLSPDQRRTLRAAAYRVADWPLRIHDDGELTLGQISALARLSARRNGMRMMAVDYAQIVNAEGRDERARVSSVSRTLTKLAKKEGCHLMLLSQLRKVPAEMYSKHPHIGDLRETGQLENDAHNVLLLHRGWDDENSRISYDAEIIVPKQRNGETGAIGATFNSRSLTFD